VIRKHSQREFMHQLVRRYGHDEKRVVREYTAEEARGEVERKSNSHGITAEQYARALWNDAVKKGWIGGLS
jgi:hypothetical protein